MAYRGKEKNVLLAKIKRISVTREIKKNKSPQNQRELVVELQTLKGITGKHLNLKIQWYNKKFKTLVNSKVIRNYILLKTVKRLKIPCR